LVENGAEYLGLDMRLSESSNLLLFLPLAVCPSIIITKQRATGS